MAEEIDAIINDPTRSFTKRANAPDKIHYARIKLDSKGKLVSSVIKEGQVTKASKVAMGSFDEKKKTWFPGEAISEGISADLFKDKGKVLRVRIKLADDEKTIQQMLITNTDEKLEKAENEFDAIFKGHGNNNFGGQVAFQYLRIELDDQGNVINKLGVTATSVSQDTKFAMGKYNEQTKRWEAGEPIEKGVWADLFNNPGAKTIYLRITKNDDGRGIAQVLVRQIGEAGK